MRVAFLGRVNSPPLRQLTPTSKHARPTGAVGTGTGGASRQAGVKSTSAACVPPPPGATPGSGSDDAARAGAALAVGGGPSLRAGTKPDAQLADTPMGPSP